ncbi:hypothetical protein QYF36_007809 [Acer negundo]|nr:hypothetical protein QYF36_007809 [Acer negundo]
MDKNAFSFFFLLSSFFLLEKKKKLSLSQTVALSSSFFFGKNEAFFFEEKRSHLFHLYIELTSLLEAARQINFSDISNQIAAEIASGRHAEDLNSGFVSASIYIQVKLS